MIGDRPYTAMTSTLDRSRDQISRNAKSVVDQYLGAWIILLVVANPCNTGVDNYERNRLDFCIGNNIHDNKPR